MVAPAGEPAKLTFIKESVVSKSLFAMSKAAAAAAEPPAAPPLRQSLRLKRVRPTPEAHLASLIREAQHCVFITGAGLSTNTGIRDYRGENGVWTEAKKAGAKEGTPGIWSDEFYRTIPGATPTLAHTGVAALVAAGHAKYVIRQNEDSLHD